MANAAPVSADLRAAYTADYFLGDCGGYETYRASGGKRLDARLECLARLIALREGTTPLRVLDLGCGRGELARHCAARGHQVTALDYAPAALQLAEACFAGEPHLRARVTLCCAAVTDPRVWCGPYDLIFAADVIEHLAAAEVGALYALAARHLAADGILIVHTFPNLWYYRYGHPLRRRHAAARGETLPADPRSAYERIMHINEQSPRVLCDQLRAAFPWVLLWAGDHQEPTGSLARSFSHHDWREAPSLFALAGHTPLPAERVVAALLCPAPLDDAMLIDNNPEIDFATLNARIAARLAAYTPTAAGDADVSPAADPEAHTSMNGAVPATGEPESRAASLAELLALEDRALVEQAHWALLGRAPTEAELTQYLTPLHLGEEKGQILAWISTQPAARAHQPALYRQLRGSRLKRRLTRLPLLGGLFRFGFALARAHVFRAQVNAQLNALYRYVLEHSRRLATLELHRDHHSQHLQQHDQQLRQQQEDALWQHEHWQARWAALEQAQARASAEERQHRLQYEEQARRHTAEREQWRQQMAAAEQALDRLRQDVQVLKARLTQWTTPPLAPGAAPPAGEDEAFYLALEHRFRGTTATIQARFSHYLPTVRGHELLSAGLPALDIGCGRGEWLQCLRAEGITAFGIDLNPHHVAACRAAGCRAVRADALDWLQAQADASLGLITAFHVVEHLEFEQLRHLLRQALRVLAPGGLLLIETPNPDNLVTAATAFRLDPTHRFPLPPALLELLLDYHGFTDIHIEPLHPIPDEYALAETSDTAQRCNRLFYGPQDYAASAVKPRDRSVTDAV